MILHLQHLLGNVHEPRGNGLPNRALCSILKSLQTAGLCVATTREESPLDINWFGGVFQRVTSGLSNDNSFELRREHKRSGNATACTY